MAINNTIISLVNKTPDAVSKEIAARVKARRLELDLTQEGLSVRSGVKLATYRKFEREGEISLKNLLQIAFALDALNDFDNLFSTEKYSSLDEMISQQKTNRKRGSKND